MTRIALELPEEVTRWAWSRVEAGEATSVDAYFANLARRDRERADETAWLQAEIDRGLASGIDPRHPREIFADVRRKYFGQDA